MGLIQCVCNSCGGLSKSSEVGRALAMEEWWENGVGATARGPGGKVEWSMGGLVEGVRGRVGGGGLEYFVLG